MIDHWLVSLLVFVVCVPIDCFTVRWVAMVVEFSALWLLFGLCMVRICFRNYVML